jgi:hypothetical protein
VKTDADFDVLSPTADPLHEADFDRMRSEARAHGQELFAGLEQQHREALNRETQKGEYAYQVRREALNRIGLPEVRRYRLRQLARDERRWREQVQKRRDMHAELKLVMIIRVVSDDE